ncbi:chaperonin 10-like protein [Xylariales sp. PMI_506]|nr:chaperonin 10-like protein [Xylariales sp. PMI_506]
MKNLVVFYDPDLKTELEDIPAPEYGEEDVLIRVVAVGSNPKDWKHPAPDYFDVKLNQGDDAAGTVEAVGRKVRGFHPGDRVAGFHVMDTVGGAYAELAVCPANTVFHIPDSLSFEEAATIPLAAYTAAVGLYHHLRLPMPFERSDGAAAATSSSEEKIPLVVNAASGAVGAFAVKLARLNPAISPIIGIAGASTDFAYEIGCDAVVDYRSGDVAGQLRAALGGRKLRHVFDANNQLSSMEYLLPLLAEGGGSDARLTFTSKGSHPEEQDRLRAESGVWNERIWVGSVHGQPPFGAAAPAPGSEEAAEAEAGRMFGAVMSTVFEWALAEGRLTGQPFTVVQGGLDGVLGALVELRDRKAGNAKFVTRIADTRGI